MAIVERLKQESMKSGLCGEVVVSGGSTVLKQDLGRTYMCMYVSVDVFNLLKHTLYKNHKINCILLRSNKADNYNDF